MRCRCTLMPLYYLFLLAIVAGVTCADYYWYGYEYWYIQGSGMLFMVFITLCVFGCGRVRQTKREKQPNAVSSNDVATANDEGRVTCMRDGLTQTRLKTDLAVGDRIILSPGDVVPADCLVHYTQSTGNSVFEVGEPHIATGGEPETARKKSIGLYHEIVLSDDTIIPAQSVVQNGNCYAFILATGNNSSQAARAQTILNEEDGNEEHEMLDKHAQIMTIMFIILFFGSVLFFVQCGLNSDIEWSTAGTIAIMMFVYGFPYILAIPSVWDIALRNISRQLLEHNVNVQNLDSIEEAASLDYLTVQSISVLDNQEDMEKHRATVKKLQSMGIKVVLATGVAEDEARRIAIDSGILKPEHENICGAVIEGSHLRKLCQGRPTGLQFDITPEYLSVVYRARAEERCMLVDYLSKVHPGRMNVQTPLGYGSESLKLAPIATVGAVGSGENDVLMLEKAQIAFSTNVKASDKAKESADMVLLNDSLEDVVMAVTKGRSYKDHLMKFLALQLPCSITAIGMVLSQAFLYDTILVTAAFVFLINLIYFPLGVVCITRENAARRWEDMQARWKSAHYPGTRPLTGYMRAEYIKYSIVVLAAYQVGALATLYWEADQLFTLVHEDLDWSNSDPLYVD